MSIDAQRLDEIIAEFSRQHEALRARLATITQLAEIMEAVRAEFSRTSPDAGRVRVFLMQRQASGPPASLAGLLPAEVALTDAEREVVLARLAELEAVAHDWRQIIESATHRLLHLPVAPAAPQQADTLATRPAEADALAIRPDDPEALAWLRENPGYAPLAANRFDAADARAFVESLYRAGAAKVVIASECMHDEDPPYADGIRVMLPDDRDRRDAVLDLVNRELEEEGFATESDRGQQVVFLWWD